MKSAKNSHMGIRFYALISAFCVGGAVSAFAASSSDEAPLLPSTAVTPIVTVVERQFFKGVPEVAGGVALANDPAGNIIFATGSSVSKYTPGGVVIWTRSHTSYENTVQQGGLEQTSYSESWGDGTDPISLGTGTDEGELVAPSAQKIVLDSAGNIYVNFSDALHQDRSLVVKFNSNGIVQWRQVSEFPTNDGGWQCKLLNMVIVSNNVVVYETTHNWYSKVSRTRLVLFPLDPGTSDRNGAWRLKKLYGAPTGSELFGRNSIGVGLSVGTNGTLLFATHDGPESSQPESLEAEPTQLVVRKLVAPYVNSGSTAGLETSNSFASLRSAEEWNDLKADAAGNFYIAGTQYFNNGFTYSYEQMVAGYNGASLAESWKNVIPTYSESGHFFDPIDATATQILMHANSFTVSSSGSDFRNDFGSEGNLTLARLSFDGVVEWQKYQHGSPIRHAFADASGNIYLLGGPYNDFELAKTFSLWKYSNNGRLQFQVNHFPPTDRDYDTFHYTAGLSSTNAILVAAAHRSDDFDNELLTVPLLKFTNPKEPQTITFDMPGFVKPVIVGSTIRVQFSTAGLRLVASSSSGLNVSFTAKNKATIRKSKLFLTGLGRARISAHQAGDLNYSAAEPVEYSVQVIDTTKPILKRVRSSVTSKVAKTPLTFTAQDNFKLAAVKYSIKPSGGAFGKSRSKKVTTKPGKRARVALSIPTATSGTYKVKIVPVDSKGNKGKSKIVTIKRK